MIFKAYSVESLAAGTSFVQDLKLGHYVKVPPRATFMGMGIFCDMEAPPKQFIRYVAQMVATILAAFIQVGVKEWIFANVPDICQPGQISHLTCPYNQVFFTASAVW